MLKGIIRGTGVILYQVWADKVAGIWGERAETEDLFLALIYYGTSLLFIVIGNYLPKIKQNNTIGIRIVWTLQDEENWNATHSFSGRIWGTSGILCMLCTLYLIKSVSKEACIKAK